MGPSCALPPADPRMGTRSSPKRAGYLSTSRSTPSLLASSDFSLRLGLLLDRDLSSSLWRLSLPVASRASPRSTLLFFLGLSSLLSCDLLLLFLLLALSFRFVFLPSLPGTLAFFSDFFGSSFVCSSSFFSVSFRGERPISPSPPRFPLPTVCPKGPATPISTKSLKAPAQFRSAVSTDPSWYLLSFPLCRRAPTRK